MPPLLPLVGEVWVRRSRYYDGKIKELSTMSNHEKLNVGEGHRVLIMEVLPDTSEVVYSRGADKRHSKALIGAFLGEYAYQNEHNMPQKGSLWVRNSKHRPEASTAYLSKCLGLGRLPPHVNAVLYVEEGLNHTDYDVDEAQFAVGRDEYDTCTIRIYNTSNTTDENPMAHLPHGPGWGGDLTKTDKAVLRSYPVIDKDFLSSKRQRKGRNDAEHHGGYIGYRLRRRWLRMYYTFVGFAPEYYEKLWWLDQKVPPAYPTTFVNIPKVGEIYKWKAGDKTDGLMVLSVSWSRRNTEEKWALARGIDRDVDGYPRMFDLIGQFKMGDEKVFDHIHWPSDWPTLIVTTVNVAWNDLNGSKFYRYWAHKTSYFEVNMFNEHLELFVDAPGAVAPLVRYREMFSTQDHALGDRFTIVNYKVQDMINDGTMQTVESIDKTSPVVDKDQAAWLQTQLINTQQPPRVNEMFYSRYFNSVCQVDHVYYMADESIMTKDDSDEHSMLWPKEPGVAYQRFYTYNLRMTAFIHVRNNIVAQLGIKARADLYKSLKFTPYDIRVIDKADNQQSFVGKTIMALPSPGQKLVGSNQVRVVVGSWIWIAELYKYIGEQGLLGKPYEETEDNKLVTEWVREKMFKTPYSIRIMRNWPIRDDPDELCEAAGKDYEHDKQVRGFLEYPLANSKGLKLLFGSVWKRKPATEEEKGMSVSENGQVIDYPRRFARCGRGSGIEDEMVLIIGPALRADYGMANDGKNHKQWVWAVNQINRDRYCGVYMIDQKSLLERYDYAFNQTEGFQEYKIDKKVVESLAGGRVRRNVEEFSVWLPPGLDKDKRIQSIYNFPDDGQWWHLKKNADLLPIQFGADPGRPRISGQWNGVVDERHWYSWHATDYVNWPLLKYTPSGRMVRRIAHQTFVQSNPDRSRYAEFIGRHQHLIAEHWPFEHRLYLFLRALRWKPRLQQVYMHNQSGQLYHIIKINDSEAVLELMNVENPKVREWRLQPETIKKYDIVFDDGAFPTRISRSLERLTNDFNGELSFLGYDYYRNWDQVNVPLIGSVYALRRDWTNNKEPDYVGRDVWQEEYERPPPLPDQRKEILTRLQSETGIKLKISDNVMVVREPGRNGEITIHLLFRDIPEGRRPVIRLSAIEFHTLFVIDTKMHDVAHETSEDDSDDEDGGPGSDARTARRDHREEMGEYGPGWFLPQYNVGKYTHFATYKEAARRKTRVRANAKMNEERAIEEATSVTTWMCMICQGETDNPEGVITSFNMDSPEPVHGYIFTHDNPPGNPYALPHCICGGCAANVIRYDRNQQDNDNLHLKQANNELIFGQYMGGTDNNGCATGPFTIDCPQCRMRHDFRRLERVELDSRTRDGEKKVVWKELENLKLKF